MQPRSIFIRKRERKREREEATERRTHKLLPLCVSCVYLRVYICDGFVLVHGNSGMYLSLGGLSMVLKPRCFSSLLLKCA